MKYSPQHRSLKGIFSILLGICFITFSCNKDDTDSENQPANEPVSLLLSNIKFYESENRVLRFTYNDENKLIKKETLGCSEDFNNYFNLQEITYNENGDILKRTGNSPHGGFEFTVDFSYNGNDLSQIEMHITRSNGGFNASYTFSSENEYDYSVDYFDLDGNVIYTRDFTGTITRNENNNIVEVYIYETNTGFYEDISFAYENGNLTEVQYFNPNQSRIISIQYDDKPNFHTYVTGTEFNGFTGNNCLRYDILGLIEVESFKEFEGFYSIFPFYSNRNANNPILISGGRGVQFNYEYNEYDYPSKVTFNSIDANYNFVLDFDYTIIE